MTRCLNDTLARTIRPMPDGTAFVVTGDIPAMWLRDSSTQMMPYLALLKDDTALQHLLLAVLRRQFQQIAHDPYANAFNAEPSGRAHDPEDLCGDPWVWEQKYEVDSLAFPLLLAHRFWAATGRTDHVPGMLRTARTVISVWRTEQDHERLSTYRFRRENGPSSDTLPNAGRGTPVTRTGMTWSGFRPSDDACAFGYNVPANLCAAAALDAPPNWPITRTTPNSPRTPPDWQQSCARPPHGTAPCATPTSVRYTRTRWTATATRY